MQHGFGWQANFILWGSLLLLTLILFIPFCPESNQRKNPHAVSPKVLYQSYKALLAHPLFVGSTLLTGIAAAGVMVYATLSPFMLQVEFHVSPIGYGWITTMASTGNILGKAVGPYLIKRWGHARTLTFGITLLLSAGIVLAIGMLFHILSIPFVMLALFLSVLSQGLIMPVVAWQALNPFPEKRGAAGALYGAFQMLTAFAISAIVGALHDGGAWVLTIAYCGLGLLGWLVYYGVLREKPALTPPGISHTSASKGLGSQ